MIITTDLLGSLRNEPSLPDDTWYIVTATALCILNRPEEIPAVYEHAVGKGHGSQGLSNGTEPVTDQEQLRIARRLREALLKASAIGGMPKVLTFPFCACYCARIAWGSGKCVQKRFSTDRWGPSTAHHPQAFAGDVAGCGLNTMRLGHQRPPRAQEGRTRSPRGRIARGLADPPARGRLRDVHVRRTRARPGLLRPVLW